MAAIPSIASTDGAERAEAARSTGLRAWAGWELPALLAVTGIGLVLRLNGFTLAPAFTDNMDEIQFTWA